MCLLTFELDRAVKLCEECIRRCDELGEQWARGTALWTRGAARWLSGDNAAATGGTRKLACLRIKERLGDLHTIAMSFDLLSLCLVATGDVERAAVLHGASEKLWTLLNAPVLMGPAYAEIRKSSADTARGALGEERFDALVGQGYAVSLSVALAVARGEVAARPPAGPAERPAPGRRRSPGASGSGRRTGRGRPRQPGHRRAPLPLQAHGRLPRGARLHQAGVLLPRPAHHLGARTQECRPDLPPAGVHLDQRGNQPIPVFIKIGGRYHPC